MELFINLTPFIVGCMNVIFSLLFNTKNMISSFIFKVLPFSVGIASMFCGAKLMGWI